MAQESDGQVPSDQATNLKKVYTTEAFQKIFAYLPPVRLKYKEIRLVFLHPGEPSDPLVCSVVATSLDSHLYFEALSYTWFDSSAQDALVPVQMNSTMVEALPNLGEALRHLRRRDRDRVLWIDFFCINQGDVKERNEQVRQMCDIYTRANSVIIFLGPESHDSGRAMDFILELGKDVHISELFSPGEDLFASVGRSFRALHSLLLRDWFSRVWVVQEVLMARMAVVQCGDMAIPWESLLQAYRQIVKHYWCCSDFFSKLPVEQWTLAREECGAILSTTLGVFESRSPSSDEPDLQARLNNFRFRLASDARDHVFGLLGTVKQSKRLIEPDYNLSIFDVFQKTAMETIIDSRSLRLFVDIRPSLKTATLPSWVPDWSQKPPSLWGINLFDFYGKFRCDTRAKPWFFSKGIMALEGVQLGRVKQLFVFPREVRYLDDFDEAYRTFFMAEKRFLTMKTYQKDESLGGTPKDEFWQLCTMDMSASDDHKRRTRPSDKAQYRKWREFVREYTEKPTQEAKAKFNNSSFAANSELEATESFHVQFWENCTFFVMKGSDDVDYMGLGIRGILDDDVVCAFKGGSLLVIIRELNKPFTEGEEIHKCHELVGLAYVHGLMDEKFEGLTKKTKWQRFYLR